MEEYVKSGRKLRQKFAEIRFGQTMRDIRNLETYKPLVKPLQELATNIKPIVKDNGEVLKYLFMYKDPKLRTHLDKTYGLEYDAINDNWFIGKKQVYFNQSGELSLKGSNVICKCTEGFLELITLKEPNRSVITAEDIGNYYKILNLTSAHRKSNGHIKGSGGKKYSEWIQPMVNFYEKGIHQDGYKLGLVNNYNNDDSEDSDDTIIPVGDGLSKIVSNTPVEYVYWNTLDELLDRLYILWGELRAGNTNSTIRNEIINILQEFKEL